MEIAWQHWTAPATPGVVSIPHEYLRAVFYGRTTIPRNLIDADEAGVSSLPSALLALMLPEAVENAARLITCSLFPGFGASAGNAWPRSDPHACALVSSLTLDVQPEAPHCASCALNRFDLWMGLAAWCRTTAGAAIGYHSSGLSGRPRPAWSRCPPTPAAAAPEEEEEL